MKIEKHAPEFQPVTITLESQGEVDLLVALVAEANGSYEDEMMYKIFLALGGMAAYDNSEYVATGTVCLRKRDR